jgi:outer membrane lipoprotein-sorting protein
MKWLMLLLSCQPVSFSQGVSASALVARVGERYRDLTAYVIQVERGNEAHAVTADVAGSGRPSTTSIFLARSGHSVHYEVIRNHPVLIWISDSKQAWRYRPDLKEYTVEPAPEWIDPPQLEDGLVRMDWEYVSKFRALAGLGDKATLLRAEAPPDSACNGRTALVKIDLSTRQAPKVQFVRIDLDSALICDMREETTRILGGQAAAYTTTTHWSYKQITGPIDPTLFTFTPPKKARQVRKFSRHLGAE